MISWVFCLVPFAAAAIMVYGWPLAPDNDLYFHLRAGERVAALGTPLLHDLFTYTVPGTPDEAWHSWVSQLVFWKTYSRFGFPGLQALNLILVWITLASFCIFVGKRTRSAGAVLVAGTVAVLLHQHTQILRPLLFGEALFAITVFSVLPFDKPLTWQRLGSALFIGVAWANLHASVVLLPLLFAAYAIGCWMERDFRRTSFLTILSPLLILCATLLNPRGIGLYSYSLELTRLGKLAGNWEWAGASPISLSPQFGGPFVLTMNLDVTSLTLLLGVLGIFFLLSRGAWACATLCTLCLLLPIVSVRHTTYLLFPLACLAVELSLRMSSAPHFRLLRPITPLLLSLTLLWGYRFHQSFDVTPSLEKTSNFIEDVGLKGNVFCEPSWSSYLLFRHYPAIRTATDNRTLVNKDFYLKARELYDRFGTQAWELMLEDAPAKTDFLLTLSWRDKPPYDLSQWLVVYENNHATLALRRNARNAENLEKVSAYFQRQQIPFDTETGFSSSHVYSLSPGWYHGQLESMPWGKWPQKSLKRVWEEKQRSFYESRKIIRKNPLG